MAEHNDRQRVHMTGSEWFGDRSGGLNRYFESLFVAMHDLKGNDITAVAFGNPPSGPGVRLVKVPCREVAP